jgi:hypothetical protein
MDNANDVVAIYTPTIKNDMVQDLTLLVQAHPDTASIRKKGEGTTEDTPSVKANLPSIIKDSLPLDVDTTCHYNKPISKFIKDIDEQT